MVSAHQQIRHTMDTVDGVDDLRTAAYYLAIERVAQAYVQRGVFP